MHGFTLFQKIPCSAHSTLKFILDICSTKFHWFAVIGLHCSCLFLFLFCSRKLHAKLSQKFLIHMCLSLIGLYISFLLSQLWGRFYNEVSNARPVCVTLSALVHYFLLVYFCISVTQSILLYMKLVMVFGERARALQEFYHINAGIISWSKRGNN